MCRIISFASSVLYHQILLNEYVQQNGKTLQVFKRSLIKFIYSDKATKFCETSTLLLSTVHTEKSKVEILKISVAFSEYMNFKSWFKVWPFFSVKIYSKFD